MNAETITWELKSVAIGGRDEGGHLPGCQHCGHEIRVLCHIESSEGARLMVGRECVKHFLASNNPDVNRMSRRYDKAAREWRKKKPEPRDGEAREDYLARRVVEMGNAYAAAKDYSQVRNHYQYGMKLVAERWGISELRYYHCGRGHYREPEYPKMGVNPPHDEGYHWGCWLCKQRKAVAEAYSNLIKEETERWLISLEAKYSANRYDFMRPLYEVRKL